MTARFMRGPKDTVLYYNLYVDPARRRVWGDGEASGTARIAGRSDGRKAEDFTIYGRIPDRQPVRSGTLQRRGQGVGRALSRASSTTSLSRRSAYLLR